MNPGCLVILAFTSCHHFTNSSSLPFGTENTFIKVTAMTHLPICEDYRVLLQLPKPGRCYCISFLIEGRRKDAGRGRERKLRCEFGLSAESGAREIDH